MLKWLASLGTGAVVAGLSFIEAHVSGIPGVDPLVAGVIVAAVTRLVHWLIGKLPNYP
jgi:hypothetical protein